MNGRKNRGGGARAVPVWLWPLALLAVLPLALVAMAKLDPLSQTLFSFGALLLFFVVNRFKSQWATVALVVLSVTISMRYLFWRMTETLHFETTAETFFGAGLFLAELYAFIVLILGFVQSAWPLDRKPTPLPDDVSLWPTVDVFIPTFNESLDVVSNTVLGAMSMDYPADRFRVHLLDDGRRPEFEAFARKVGCSYLTRSDNRNAKAGNLNAALDRTDAELVAIFDSDHVPTRAFLQMTVGAFLANRELSLVQTPHHFYSPDPFERNVAGGAGVPNEGQLFYGLLQQGNDFWGAAFFCGSCAVIRRTALEDIGGFATETVTEDAHTALKLHRRGWQSAYLRLPLAAGLATERLALHIGQRMRWARGMTQIFRLDNPLLGRGLSLAQRLCYLNAMLHFFFSLPRFIFLTAPLAYLLAEQNIIAATWENILIYALPHLAHAALTNSRVHGRYRYTFWGEIYESVLSFHIMKPTFLTLLNPRKGSFNVTDKGGLLPEEFFDRSRVAPHLAVAGLLVIALALGCVRLSVTELDLPLLEDVDAGVVALNMFWAGFNLFLVLAAISVARERRQIRAYVRVPVALEAEMTAPGSAVVQGRSVDMSMGGGMFAFSGAPPVAVGDVVKLEISTGSERLPVEADVVGVSDERVRVRFGERGLAQQSILVRLIFGRADAWLNWDDRPEDSVSRSTLAVFKGIGGMFSRSGARPRRVALGAGQAAAALLILAISVGGAAAQTSDSASALPPPPAPMTMAEKPMAAPAPTDAEPERPVLPNARSQPDPEALLPWDAPSVDAAPLQAAPGGAVRRVPFAAIGIPDNIEMRTVRASRYAGFSLRADRVIDAAILNLAFSYGPSLLPDLSNLYVFLNGEPVGRVRLAQENAGGVVARLPVKPALLGRRNVLRFDTNLHYREQCEDPVHEALRLTIHAGSSSLELAERPLAFADDLALLPLPFVDPSDMAPQRLTFVLPPNPSNAVLEAAGVAASYFGAAAPRNGLEIVVSFGAWGEGSAVVFLEGDAAPAGVKVQLPKGVNTLAVTGHGAGRPGAKALILAGADDAGLLSVARQLAHMPRAEGLEGPSVEVVAPPNLPERRPDDARRWLPLDRPVALGELVEGPERLQSAGVSGYIAAPFIMPPRHFTDAQNGPILKLEFDSLESPLFDFLDPARSRLDISLNGEFQRTLPLRPRNIADDLSDALRGETDEEGRALVRLDPAILTAPRSKVEFYYEMFPLKGECIGSLPDNVRLRVQPSSTIDFSQSVHRLALPDLSSFAAVGYPFTRMADLSETVAALPAAPQAEEVAAYLNLMAMAGEATGEAAMLVSVARPAELQSEDKGGHGDKDMIVVGTWDSISDLVAGWGGAGLFAFEEAGVRIRPASTIETFRHEVMGDDDGAERDAAGAALGAIGDGFSGVASFERPDAGGRVVVMVSGATPAHANALVARLRDPSAAGAFRGDLARVTPTGVQSYAVNPQFTLSETPRLEQLRWFLADRPFLLVAFLLAGVGLMTIVLYWLLQRIAAARVADMREE